MVNWCCYKRLCAGTDVNFPHWDIHDCSLLSTVYLQESSASLQAICSTSGQQFKIVMESSARKMIVITDLRPKMYVAADVQLVGLQCGSWHTADKNSLVFSTLHVGVSGNDP